MEKETRAELCPQSPDERLRHALCYLDEARRTVVEALELLARQEHEREAEREAVLR
jgi:hypothetical protein